MSLESARAFVEAARQDKTLRKVAHQCVLARDAETLVKLGQQYSYAFTSLEIKQAIATGWDDDVPASWQDPHLDEALMDPDHVDFFLHRANRDYLLGKRRVPILRHRGWLTWHYMMVAALSAGLMLLFGSIYFVFHAEFVELRDNGVVTRGEIVDHHKDWTYRRYASGYTYYVSFKFTVLGRDYSAEQDVSLSRYEALKDGDSVAILYSPSDPKVAVLDGMNSDPIVALPIAVGFAMACAFIVGKAIYDYRLEVGYNKEGTLVLGEITDLKQNNYVLARRDGFHANTLDVAFDSPNKQQKITDSVRHGWSLSRQYAPHKGDTIAIFYVDAEHWWLL